jgi:VanZ family protein
MIRVITLTTLALYWASLFVGTHLPKGIGSLPDVNDKLMHYLAYAGLTFLLAAALTSFRLRFRPLLIALLVAAVYGGFDELSQLAVPGRKAELADWGANVFGATTGVVAFVLLIAMMKRFRKPEATQPNGYEHY